MLFVVNNKDKKILARFEAWDVDCYDNAYKFIEDNGYVAIGEDITINGDMSIFVK